jgi:hypothetical protein
MMVSFICLFLCLFNTYEMVFDTLIYEGISLHAKVSPQRVLDHLFDFLQIFIVSKKKKDTYI